MRRSAELYKTNCTRFANSVKLTEPPISALFFSCQVLKNNYFKFGHICLCVRIKNNCFKFGHFFLCVRSSILGIVCEQVSRLYSFSVKFLGFLKEILNILLLFCTVQPSEPLQNLSDLNFSEFLSV